MSKGQLQQQQKNTYPNESDNDNVNIEEKKKTLEMKYFTWRNAAETCVAHMYKLIEQS